MSDDPASETSNLPDADHSSRRAAAIAAGLFTLVLIVYIPAMSNGFIWDDDSYVTENPVVTGPSGFGDIWLNPKSTPQYYPMVFTMFRIEHAIWGLNATGFHVVNIALHAMAAILLWRILVLLELPGALLIAALFAVHPVHVESVAWITERKNTLSGVFYLAAMLMWLTAWKSDDARSSTRLLVFSFVAFVAALLSKSVTCSLPAALLVIVWWKTGEIERSNVARVAPMFVVGLVAAFMTVWMETHHVGTKRIASDITFWERGLVAGRAIVFYFSKIVWPMNLSFIYPRWEIDTNVWWQHLYPTTIVVGMVLLWSFRNRIGRGPLAAFFLYFGTLLPALGFIDVYPHRFSWVADHFQYLASISAIALIGTAAARYLPARVFAVTGAAVVGCLAVLTWQQCAIYENAETVWRDTLSKNPNCALALTNLAVIHIDQAGPNATAEERSRIRTLLKNATAADPNFEGAWLRLGLIDAGSSDAKERSEAVQALFTTIELWPDCQRAQVALAQLLATRHPTFRAEDAIPHFEKAIELDPNDSVAKSMLAQFLLDRGDSRRAATLLRDALELTPDDATNWYNLGLASGNIGNHRDAAVAYSQAIKLKPDFAFAHFNLGNLYAGAGDFQSAITHYREAIRAKPDFDAAKQNLAAAEADLRNQ